MVDWLDRIGEAWTVNDVLRVCGEEFDLRGVTMRSYHFADSFSSQVGPGVGIVSNGYPQDWLALYDDPAFRASDPIPDFILRSGRTMTWEAAIAAQKLTGKQQEFVAALRQHGLIHGIGAPLYGPNGREAYCAFSFGRDSTQADVPLIRLLVTIAQTGHRRITALTQREAAPPQLSEREHEVLHWMMHGKSVRDIATIIDRAPGTVETFVKRIYAKLGVNDRSGAMIVALRYGLVKL